MFSEKLLQAMQRNSSLLCVGLDPDPALMPQMDIFEFNRAIVDATADLVCAYKPNLAFYEALGVDGLVALQKTVKYIPDDIPVIGDGKRGDIGNTARAYATALFEVFGFDAATVNPYLGYDSVEPFMAYSERGTFLLCRTSNAGAADFQALACWSPALACRQQPLFTLVAQKAKEWNRFGNLGLVVGATYPQELKEVREVVPEMTLLIPGIGAQGGDLEAAVRYGTDAAGRGAVFNSSRQVLYASKGRDFAEAARRTADGLRCRINSLLAGPPAE
ncbi:MAG: orotidine-5'-phosphate decarboxylase [Chloroflexi bacterium]|nr:MAG: orotidine-5'-phosphate decarboxylase [Chloroflexota bacterium]